MEIDINNREINVIYNSVLRKEGLVQILAEISLEDINLDYNDENKYINIGNAFIYLFNNYMIDSVDELIEDLHLDVQNVYEAINALEECEEEIYTTVAVIDNIEIDESLRENGFGTALLTNITNYLETLNVSCIVVTPSYLSENNKYSKNLIAERFFESNDFEILTLDKDRPTVMIKSL